jgi:tagaturonate reductase
MQLSKQILNSIPSKPELIVPDPKLFDLPERVLQFGTGVLLRGLPDFFIDKANRQGIFNGRIVVVKSTSNGGTDDFEKQDGLFTLCVRGIENGKEVDQRIINSSISRVISAANEWEEVLEAAVDPNINIIISNTTEVGIQYVEEDIKQSPPASFPGKLLACLYQRFLHIGNDNSKGMVIIPTELIIDNGNKLREILVRLAQVNKLGDEFIDWLQSSNHFCNSLVDRIVPGKFDRQEQEKTCDQVGYDDELMIMAEPFRLWAIESNDARVSEVLSFAKADQGMIIAPDIEKFRELKLRLLNGTHSFTCGLASLAGFKTVRDAMEDERMKQFVTEISCSEISMAITGELISRQEAIDFSAAVIERFCNPFLEHKWESIALQYTSKMKLRNIPILLSHYKKTSDVPRYMALGFAAYILFAARTGVTDDSSAPIVRIWQEIGIERLAEKVFGLAELWSADLNALPGFTSAVQQNLEMMEEQGALKTLRYLQTGNKERIES